jgi:aminodeoxyfutalosine deaminase
MFGTTLNREYAVAADLLGLAEAGVTDLARAAVDASFAPAAVRERLHREITAYASGGPVG